MAGFSSKKPPSMRNDRLDELLPIYKYKDNDGKTVKFRPFGNIISYEYVWFYIKTEQGKVIQIPKLCTDLDPLTDEYVADDCPFRKSGLGRSDRFYLVNAIYRKAVDLRPAKLPKMTDEEKKYVKTDSFDEEMRYVKMGSDVWTPVVPLQLSSSAARNLATLEAENIVDGKPYGVTDLDYGFDIAIKYDSKGTGTGKFQLTDGNNATAITDKEMDYHVYNLDVLKYPSLKANQEEWKNLKEKITDPPKDIKKGGGAASRRLEEDEEEDDVRNRKPANSGKLSSGRSRRVEEDEEVPY